MANSDVDAVVVGGGAAGIAAARRLHEASVRCLLLEARSRLGGRAWTINAAGHAIDLGCGWLHSADRNPWSDVARAQGRTIDKTPPPWRRASLPVGFATADQSEFFEALNGFYDRLELAAAQAPDAPAATLLNPGDRWNPLINAVSTYANGDEL